MPLIFINLFKKRYGFIFLLIGLLFFVAACGVNNAGNSCSFGTYAGTSGGSAACIPCNPGTYSSTYGSTQCTACSPGTFANTSGSEACTECSAGTFSSTYGSVACIACPSGYTSSAGASTCTP